MDAGLVSLVSDIVVGLSAVVIAIVGVYGVRSWRAELAGKAKFEVARNVVVLGLKLKDDFERARSPFTSSQESAGRQRGENELPAVAANRDEWHARICRLQPLREDLRKLKEAGWHANIVLGEDASKTVSEAVTVLTQSFGELYSAIEYYFETRDQEARSSATHGDREWRNGLSRTVYSRPGDDFSKRLDEAIDRLASTLRAYVK